MLIYLGSRAKSILTLSLGVLFGDAATSSYGEGIVWPKIHWASHSRDNLVQATDPLHLY